MFSPVQRRKLSHDVLDQLSALIDDGTFAPGSQLPSETELGQRFGVGRPSVREALQALERQGVVRIVHGERPRVLEPSPDHLLTELGPQVRRLMRKPDGVLHFAQARLFLEVGLVRHACEEAAGDQVDALRAALVRNRDAVGDPARFRATDIAFHRTLAEIPANPVLLALHEGAVAWIIGRRPPAQYAERYQLLSLAEHEAILRAIEARDADAAARAMRKHLIDAHERHLPD